MQIFRTSENFSPQFQRFAEALSRWVAANRLGPTEWDLGAIIYRPEIVSILWRYPKEWSRKRRHLLRRSQGVRGWAPDRV